MKLTNLPATVQPKTDLFYTENRNFKADKVYVVINFDVISREIALQHKNDEPIWLTKLRKRDFKILTYVNTEIITS